MKCLFLYPFLLCIGHVKQLERFLNIGWVDGWMFELFIDAQPQKGIKRLNDCKNTILHNELSWKKT